MNNFIILRCNGEIEVVETDDICSILDKSILYYVQQFYSGLDWVYFISDDNGITKELDINRNASILASYNCLLGDVILAKDTMFGYSKEFKGFSKEEVEIIKNRIEENKEEFRECSFTPPVRKYKDFKFIDRIEEY